MSFVLAVISFIIVLGPLIIIHELGHFIACRLVGVTVLEFGIGIPPRALRLFERNGTEFTLNWLPLGGFVRPLGEDFVRPLSPESTEADKAAYTKYQAELEALGRKVQGPIKGVLDVGPWSRLFFLAAGSGMNFLGAVVILSVAAMLGIPAAAPVVGGAGIGSPALSADLQFGDVILAVNGNQVTDTAGVEAALDADPTKAVTLTVSREGETRDVILEPAERKWPRQQTMITTVVEGAPADGVFEVGDIIVSVNGKTTALTASVQEAVNENAGSLVQIVVIRKGEPVTLEVTPRENPPAGQGAVGITLIQLTYNLSYGLAAVDSTNGRIERLAFGDSISYGLRQSGAILERLVMFPVELVRGAMTIQEARPVSIVGISQIGSQALERTLEDREPHWVLNFAALISLALGFTNLLPIPGLDGGRILFVFVEILRGKPMNPAREGVIHLIGLMIILGLFVILVINDFVNPIGQVLR